MSEESSTVEAFGLAQKEIDRFKDIMRYECGVELTNEEAWSRAIELIALAKLLAEASAKRAEKESPQPS